MQVYYVSSLNLLLSWGVAVAVYKFKGYEQKYESKKVLEASR